MSGLQPSNSFRPHTQGFALGWYMAALSALNKDMAVSRLKCNVFEVVVPVCHEVEVGQEDFCWALPTE